MFECQNVYWKMRRIVHPNTWNSRIPQEIVFLGHEERQKSEAGKEEPTSRRPVTIVCKWISQTATKEVASYGEWFDWNGGEVDNQQQKYEWWVHCTYTYT